MPDIPFRREHTGVAAQDRAQLTAQQAARKTNSLDARVAVLEALLLEGRTTIPMLDANKTITAAQLARWVIRATGALTAARILNGFPHPASESEAYTRLVHNNTTGGFNVTVSTGTGTTAAIGAAGSAIVQFSTTGAVVYVL